MELMLYRALLAGAHISSYWQKGVRDFGWSDSEPSNFLAYLIPLYQHII